MAARTSSALSQRGEPDDVSARGKKSVLASGLLSLFLGPIGWLYAGSFREAVPGALAWILIAAIIPHFLLGYLVGLIGMVSGGAGVLYAWSYNRSGRRETLILKDAPTPPALPR